MTRLIVVPISSLLRDALSNSRLKKDWMIMNNELERLRKEARLVLALDKRSVQLAAYDDVVVAVIIDHLSYIFKCCINIVAYFT
jgi:PP-loop superfamily ATP-utilizing enzyme